MKKLFIALFLGVCVAAEQKDLPGIEFLLEQDPMSVNSGIESYVAAIESNKESILDEGEEYSELSYGIFLGCYLWSAIVKNERVKSALVGREPQFIDNLAGLVARFKGQDLFDVADVRNFFIVILKFSDEEVQANASIQGCLSDVVEQYYATTLEERGRVGGTRRPSVSATVARGSGKPRLGSARFGGALQKKAADSKFPFDEEQ